MVRSAKSGKNVSCALAACPKGCTVLTLGKTSVHLSDADYLKLLKAMLHHAWVQGLEVPAEVTERPLPVYH